MFLWKKSEDTLASSLFPKEICLHQVLHSQQILHCMKSVRIRTFSDPCFPTFGLNLERYGVQMLENTDQKNSEYGHFSRNLECKIC